MNAPASWQVEVREADFDQQVMRKSHEAVVVVDFWAPWCQPCRMLAPILEKVIREHQGAVVLAKVNTDEEQNLAAQFRIEALPTVIVFREGQIAFQFQGLVMEQQFRELLDRLMPTQAETLAKQAERIETSEPARAEAFYRQALAQDERLDRATVGLARVLIHQDKKEEAKRLLDSVAALGDLADEVEHLNSLIALQPAASSGDEDALRQALQLDPKNAQKHFDLGVLLAARGDYASALEELLRAGELDYKLLTAQVREKMVQIFHVIGNQSPLANDYRQKLATLLY